MKVVRVKIDGTMDELSITKNKNIKKSLDLISISKGTSQFKLLYKWNLDMKVYECYGWFDGDAGFENKHELIPNGNSSFLEENSSEILLFGDIFILCKQNDSYINLDISSYGEIFSLLCGGFDECETSDEELPDSEEEELDYDENEYSDED